jgi:protein-tyrosine phosphatase
MKAVFLLMHLMPTPVPTPFTLQGASNFRDLGGYLTAGGQRVRRGQVFRSDHLAGLTDADVARLQALGVGHSLDFRGVAEYTATP